MDCEVVQMAVHGCDLGWTRVVLIEQLLHVGHSLVDGMTAAVNLTSGCYCHCWLVWQACSVGMGHITGKEMELHTASLDQSTTEPPMNMSKPSHDQ